MIEKLLEQVESQQKDLLKTKGIIRAHRNRLEIELGGVQARRDAEHAENLRVQINDCHDAEKFLQKGLDHLGIVGTAIREDYAPEHAQHGPRH